MTKTLVYRQVLQLRKEGKSYSLIKKELGLSKSTLSVWLRDYPLTKEQINALRANNAGRIEKYRKTMQQKREKKLRQYYTEEKKALLPLSKRELFIAGLFLYWGEGGKTLRGSVSINNTDPGVLKFALCWLRNALDIPKEKITVYMHLYSDMNVDEEISFWSKELHMPRKQFSQPYIKQSTRISIDHKGFGHGTCGLRVCNTELKERILMAIKAVTEDCAEKVVEF